MADIRDIGLSAALNILGAISFLLAFAFLRLQPINDRVYFPKWYLKGARESPSHGGPFVRKFVNLDMRSYLKFLSWMPAALKMPEDELISHAGLDSAVYLRIYLVGLKIFAPISILAFSVLVPVNWTNDTLEFLKRNADQTSSRSLCVIYRLIQMLFFLGACPISWQSTKQKVVALSTCEAEYIAAATACCQGVWLGRLLAELTGEDARAPFLMVDNQSAIALAKNPVHHDRSKHIDTKFHYIRDCVDGGQIKLEHVETARQLGDILTKPLGRVRLTELRTKIGVEEIKQEQCD